MAWMMMWWKADEARCPYCRCRFLRSVSKPGFMGSYVYPIFGLHVYRCIDCMTETLLTRRAASEIPPENPALDPKKVVESLDRLRETPRPTAAIRLQESAVKAPTPPPVVKPIRPSAGLVALRKAWLQASEADREVFLRETDTKQYRETS